MKDDPKEYSLYKIVVPPRSLVLTRDKEEWYLSNNEAIYKIPVESRLAEKLARDWAHIYEEEDWIYRHSLQFRWLRFWYRRKKRRDDRI